MFSKNGTTWALDLRPFFNLIRNCYTFVCRWFLLLWLFCVCIVVGCEGQGVWVRGLHICVYVSVIYYISGGGWGWRTQYILDVMLFSVSCMPAS